MIFDNMSAAQSIPTDLNLVYTDMVTPAIIDTQKPQGTFIANCAAARINQALIRSRLTVCIQRTERHPQVTNCSIDGSKLARNIGLYTPRIIKLPWVPVFVPPKARTVLDHEVHTT